MIAYKLLRKRRDGSLGPLFINKAQRIPLNTWLPAEEHRTKGYAFRPGWHCCAERKAPHLKEEGRVWCKVEVNGVKAMQRPEAQGGFWYLANWMEVLEVLC